MQKNNKGVEMIDKYKKYLMLSAGIILINIIYSLISKLNIINMLGITAYTLVIYFATIILLENEKFNFTSPAILFAGLYIVLVAIGPFLLLPQKYEYHFNALVVIGSAYVCYIIGYFLIKQFPTIKINFRKIDKININKELFLILLIGASGILWLVYIFKNITSIFSGNFENDRITSQAGNGAFLYLIRMWIITIPLLYEEQLKKGKVKKWFYVIVFLAICALLMLGGRTPIVLILLNLILCNIIVRKIDTKKMIKYAAIIVLVIAVLGSARALISGNKSSIISSTKSILLNGNYNLSYIFSKFPGRVNFQYGYTYLINLKMLMPGKDIDFTLWLKDKLGMHFSGGGVTPTIVGEFYINFGYIGIFIGMILVGVLCRFLTRYLEKSECKAFPIFLCLEICLAVYGGLANASIPILLYSLVYGGICLFSNKTIIHQKEEN